MKILLLGIGLQIAFGTSQYHHKARHASIVLGSTLYIDGGERTTVVDYRGGLNTTEDANTYSIDLSQPWSNDTVVITSIRKTTRSFQSGALWAANSSAFFSFDGGISLASSSPKDVPLNELLVYTPTGRWAKVDLTSNATLLQRVQEGTYASGNGLGFALGGYRSLATTQDANSLTKGNDYVPGMVVYNSTSHLWYNVTAGGYYGTKSSNGAGHFVPNFGPVGLFMAFGGLLPDTDQVLPLDQISIYEPISQQWSLQRTTGDIPHAVQNPCVVGAAGSNGTYEIFLFGGAQQVSNRQRLFDGSVYVLSLPSFVWLQVPATVPGRWRHSCSVKNRQMISIGGKVVQSVLNQTENNDWDTSLSDPWPEGLGVFDMSALQWVSRYDSEAAPYVTSNAVRSKTAATSTLPELDSRTKSWFATTRDLTPSSDSSANSTNTNNSSTDSTNSTSSGPSKAVIAGAVVGGVVGLALIGVLAFLLVRRRRKRTRSQEISAYESEKHELYGSADRIYELTDKTRPHEAEGQQIFELTDKSKPAEAQGNGIYELDNTSRSPLQK